MSIFWDYDNGYIVRKPKKDARTMYESGEAIMLLANKANPNSPFYKPWTMVDNKGNVYEFMQKEQTWKIVLTLDHARDFDSMVREFEYYNCNSEIGNYASFYVRSMV